MNAYLNIIEPTLQNQSGHCHSFVASLCSVGRDYPLKLWVSDKAVLPDLEETTVIKHYFHRRLRKFQAFLLYASLLRQPGKIVVSTAGRLDAMMLNWAATGVIPLGKVYLYFHWIRPSPDKRRFFSKIATRQPNILFMAPTESVASFFRECGIANVSVIPYPISALASLPIDTTVGFKHLLYAGAARNDKGFGLAVKVVEQLVSASANLPVTLQISPEHYGKLEEQVRDDIERLRAASYPPLRLCPETLSTEEYRSLFEGAICLQLYNQQDFADRISGVTLDAMSSGAPVVTLTGTWIAKTVARFGGGVVVDDSSPDTILAAVRQIITSYADYRNKALKTGSVMNAEHSAAFLCSALTHNIQPIRLFDAGENQ